MICRGLFDLKWCRISEPSTVTPEDRPKPKKERIVIQPSIFRCYVSFKECTTSENESLLWGVVMKKSCQNEPCMLI